MSRYSQRHSVDGMEGIEIPKGYIVQGLMVDVRMWMCEFYSKMKYVPALTNIHTHTYKLHIARI